MQLNKTNVYQENPKEVSKINTRLNLNVSEYSKIKISLDNLKNTFGVDILKAVVMSELTLTEGK